ncbi:MAG: multiheme c-type cytochrome [Candidatus Acidiferrales bacterium]
MSPRKRILIVLLGLAVFYSPPLQSQQANRPAARDQAAESAASRASNSRADFAGDKTCMECHQEEAELFERTGHHLTSQLADKDSILGNFTKDSNVVRTSNPLLFYQMTSDHQGYFQTAVMGIPPDTTSRTEQFAIVIGSGKRGQTYLYWKGAQLFELPVSYWTDLHAWVNSPGYPDGMARFDRPIIPRCLECHASYFESLPGHSELNNSYYEKANFVLGISCETCHGPGRKHVNLERSNGGEASANSIVNPSKLPRDRQVDLCALCHGGAGAELLEPSFTYSPGKPLSAHIRLQNSGPDALIDVHGNQVGLLEKSQCFQSSKSMTCSTCHAVHAPEKPDAAYSSRCLTCHTVQSCGEFRERGNEIAAGCISCHMPAQDSNVLFSTTDGRKARVTMHNHWIKVYPPPQKP